MVNIANFVVLAARNNLTSIWLVFCVAFICGIIADKYKVKSLNKVITLCMCLLIWHNFMGKLAIIKVLHKKLTKH